MTHLVPGGLVPGMEIRVAGNYYRVVDIDTVRSHTHTYVHVGPSKQLRLRKDQAVEVTG
jgi:hypothetical protein